MSGLDELKENDRTILICRSEEDISTYIKMYGKGELKTLIILDGVRTIPENAFDGCTALTSVEFPKNMPVMLCRNAFSNCGLLSLTLPRTVTFRDRPEYYEDDYYEDDGSEQVFSQCKDLKTVVIEDGVQRIPSYAFSGCTALISVEFPKNEEIKLYRSAFENCGLLSLTLPYTITFAEFGDYTDELDYGNNSEYVFNWCQNLKTVVIEDGVAWIPPRAFANCTGLISVEFPKYTPIELYQYSFMNCGLLSLTIPATTTLGNSAEHVFGGCRSLKTLIIDDREYSFIDSGRQIGNIFFECPLQKIITNDEFTGELFLQVFPEIIIEPTEEWIAESETNLSEYLHHPYTGLDALLGYLYEPEPSHQEPAGEESKEEPAGVESKEEPAGVEPSHEAFLGYLYEPEPSYEEPAGEKSSHDEPAGEESSKEEPTREEPNEMEGGGITNIFSKYHNNRIMYHRLYQWE